MSDLHRCDQIDYLRELGKGLAEMRTVLYGPEGSSDGFIKSTIETLEIVSTTINGFATQVPLLQAATTAMAQQITELTKQVNKLFLKPKIKFQEAVPIIVSIVSTAGLILVAIIYASKRIAK